VLLKKMGVSAVHIPPFSRCIDLNFSLAELGLGVLAEVSNAVFGIINGAVDIAKASP